MKLDSIFRGESENASRRGMVPLAVIGALVLLSAVALVGSVQIQSPPDVDTDATTAMERTEVSSQSALEQAVVRATAQAAEQPLTTTKNTTYGRELAAHATDDTDIFRTYLKALIVTEAHSVLPPAGQQVGAVETTVSTPDIEDSDSFGDALEQVTITETDDGLLTVALSGVEIQSEVHGDPIESETKTLSVTIQSPLFELHERAETFQDRLDTGLHESGFSQRFNAQVYALGWARGYAQYGGAPITEVIANRHLEPITNQALYRTQQDVFGQADPALGNAIRQGWFCMAVQDAEGLYEGYSNSETNISADICSGSQWLFGDEQTGEAPDAPETTDLLGAAPGMDATHTIGVNETAYLPFRRLVASEGTHSLDSVIERALTVETTVDSTVEASRVRFDHDKPNESATVTDSDREHVETTIDSSSVENGLSGRSEKASRHDTISISELTGSVTVRDKKTWKWENSSGTVQSAVTTDTETADINLSLDIVVEALAPDSLAFEPIEGETLDEWDIADESDLLEGRSVFASADSFAEAVLIEVAGDSTDTAVAEWLETELDVLTATMDVSHSTTETVSLDDQVSGEVRAKLLDDLRPLQSETATVSHTFERNELIHGGDTAETSPIEGLMDQVQNKRVQSIDQHNPAQTVEDVVQQELRYSYFELLLEDLETLDDGHAEAVSGLDETLEDIDDGLEQGLDALQQGVQPEKPDPESIESPDRGEDISYEIRGSPTYLTTETVTAEEIPQVGTTDEFVPLSLKNHNQLQMPYETIIDGFFDRLASFFGFGDPDAELSLQMAGEAVRAGQLATTAAERSEYGSYESLASGTDTIREETEVAIDEFADEFRKSLLHTLYPDDIRVVDSSSEPVHRNLSSVPKTCQSDEFRCEIPDESTAAAAEQQIVTALEAQFDEYESVGERAIAIGDGKMIESLTQRMKDDLRASEYQPTYLNTSVAWEGTIESSVYPAFMTAAQDQHITLSDVEELEQLDERIREALSAVSSDMLEDRLSSTGKDQFDIEQYDDWVDGVDTPVRVPAGVPLLPVPGMWYATINTWNVQAHGEYSRFELRANLTTTDTTTSLTYVRDDSTVTVPVTGEDVELGTVDPISFNEETTLIVIVPPGGIGVGDRNTENPECSPLYPHTGAVNGQEAGCE